MSNDAQALDRLFKLQAKINMMVVDGTRSATKVADALQQILMETREYLRHIESITLAPTKGSVTFAEAEDVFLYRDKNFKKWGTNVPGEDTDEASVDVHEMTRDGTFRALFESLGDPRQLTLSQGQIVEFCRNHHNLLRQDGYGTFFLFEVNGELFAVDVVSGRLRAYVRRFEYDYVWSADCRHHLVAPQQII